MSQEEYLNKVREFDKTTEKPKELDNTEFLTVVKERKSVRQYDSTFKMEENEIRDILEVAIEAPSSSNLQSWRFLVIQDQAKKEELLPIANNQQQIVDASVVIAVLGDHQAYKNADQIYSIVEKSGRMTKEIKDNYVNTIVHSYGNFSEKQLSKIAMIDGGLVSMQLMLAAKAKGYDTSPIGGFDAEKFVEAFHVPENLEPVMLIALGKGTKAGFSRTRLPLDEVLKWNKY